MYHVCAKCTRYVVFLYAYMIVLFYASVSVNMHTPVCNQTSDVLADRCSYIQITNVFCVYNVHNCQAFQMELLHIFLILFLITTILHNYSSLQHNVQH